MPSALDICALLRKLGSEMAKPVRIIATRQPPTVSLSGTGAFAKCSVFDSTAALDMYWFPGLLPAVELGDRTIWSGQSECLGP